MPPNARRMPSLPNLAIVAAMARRSVVGAQPRLLRCVAVGSLKVMGPISLRAPASENPL